MACRKSGPKHPKGLSGREIGEFYKERTVKKSVERRKKEDQQLGPSVILSNIVINDVKYLLKGKDENHLNKNASSDFEDQFKMTINISFDDFLKGNINNNDSFVNTELDMEYTEKFRNMLEKESYKEIFETRRKLPVFEKKYEILESIFNNQVVLISGDTGCGKTTQIPQYVLDEYLQNEKGSLCNIVCTQPRRISAITVAERVAWERTERLGHSVGYQIRLERVAPRAKGTIIYCTTGIILRQMETDPLLQNISHIVLDEIHERDVDTDILLGLLKQICPYRKDLKIILMSATFRFEAFCNYFNNCPVITIHGMVYPVERKYLEDILQETRFNNFPRLRAKKIRGKSFRKRNSDDVFREFIEPYLRSIEHMYSKTVIENLKNPASEEFNIDLLTALIFYISFNKSDGAILVFLSGYDKISKLYKEITNSRYFNSNKFLLYPLHSMMPTADQKSIFKRPPRGVRKIILATSIAETSITIDDIVYVIDTGKIKITDYHVEKNLQMLEEKWVTLANSTQRRGRAGRVQPGVCYHLYTKAREYTLDQYPTPEILRTKLESKILNVKMLHINDVKTFFSTLLDIPHENTLENSINLLKRINALDDNEFITPLGLHLGRLPLDPQTGKMVLMASIFQCINPITSVAASLSFKDAFYRPLGKEKHVEQIKLKFAKDTNSDHLMLANVLNDLRSAQEYGEENNFCYNNFLSLFTLKQLERMKLQFCELLHSAQFIESRDPLSDENNINSSNNKILRAVICAGLYPNVAYIRKIKHTKNRVVPNITLTTPEDGKVEFHPSSINSKQGNFESRFFVYYMKQKSSSIYLYDTTMVHALPLLLLGDGVVTGVNEFGKEFISVADRFRFESNKETSDIILTLRKEFENILQKKALNPSPIDYGSYDGNVLKAIIYILKSEGQMDYESDSDNE